MNDDHNIELSHDRVSQALQMLFVEHDQSRAFEEVSAHQVHLHVAGCEACRRQYDALALCDRLLADDGDSGPHDLGPHDLGRRDLDKLARAGFETGFGDAAFLGALDEMLAQETTENPSEAKQSAELVDLADRRAPLGPMTRWLSVAAAVVVIGAGSWLAWQHLQHGPQHAVRPQDPGEFQARSAASTTHHGPFAQPKLEVFCAHKTAEGVSFRGAKDAPFGLLKCPVDAEIKLAYANPSPQLHYAAFFGVDHTGTLYWYGPTPADVGAVAVSTTSALRPVGQSIRLQVNHRPGKMRVFGLFAVEPIDFARLRRLVDNLDAARLYDDGLPDALPIRGASTSSTFEVTHGGQR